MLRKLIKYELKSMLRIFIPVWIAFLALWLLFCLTYLSGNFEALLGSNAGRHIFMSGIALWVAGINVIGFVLVIQRFYTGLFKDEGYLTFTLPVKPWQHLSAKGITAVMIIAFNMLLCIIAGVVWTPGVLAGLEVFFNIYRQYILRTHFEYLPDGFNSVVLITPLRLLFSAIKLIFQAYASIALGHLASRHRLAWSFGAFIGIEVALSIVLTLSAAFWGVPIVPILSTVPADFMKFKLTGDILNIFCIVAFFVVTERILSKKLNLE